MGMILERTPGEVPRPRIPDLSGLPRPVGVTQKVRIKQNDCGEWLTGTGKFSGEMRKRKNDGRRRDYYTQAECMKESDPPEAKLFAVTPEGNSDGRWGLDQYWKGRRDGRMSSRLKRR